MSCNAKSLATHKNDGNASARIFSSPDSPDLTCICLVKFTTSARFSIADSSIGPIEFYTN